MPVGVVTGFTHNGSEYDVPTSKVQRRQFADELKSKIEALDGVSAAYNADATRTWDNVRLEIELDTTERRGRTRLIPNPRSISPRIRNVFKQFTPLSDYHFVLTPEPVNVDENLYETTIYIVEVWFY